MVVRNDVQRLYVQTFPTRPRPVVCVIFTGKEIITFNAIC